MSPLDWDGDSELQALRVEFLASLPERLAAHRLVWGPAPGWAPIPESSLAAAREVAHRLAGVSGSYGFPALGRIAGALDDLLEPQTRRGTAQPIEQVRGILARALDRALASAVARQADPAQLLEDKELEQAIFVAESLALSASL